MRLPYRSVALVIGVAVFALLLPPPYAPVRPAAASSVTIFSDDFEGPWPNAVWTASDAQPAGGLDYWGANVGLVTAHGGQSTVWCAQTGTSSMTGNANAFDGVYDNDMDARLVLHTPDLAGYASVDLTFWAWWSNAPASDRFSLQASADGTSYTERWGVGQGTSNNWEQVTLSIPLDTRYIRFVFFSDSATESIGAFVDDLALVGTDVTPPAITHTPVTAASVGTSIPITATITDGVGVSSATLYYESVGQSTFAALPMTASGATYNATIPAQASAGTLRYYIEATDAAGNTARAPAGGASSPYSVAISIPENYPLSGALIAISAVVLAAVLLLAFLAWRRRARRPLVPVTGPPISPPVAPTTHAPPTSTATPPPSSVAPGAPSSTLPDVTPQAPSAPGPPVLGSVPGLCPACGFANAATSIFCNRCGTRLR